MNGSDKEKKDGTWISKLLHFVIEIACIAGILWLVISSIKVHEEANDTEKYEAQREQIEREEEIYERGVKDGWNMLLEKVKNDEDILNLLWIYEDPQDVKDEVEDGAWTREELVELYKSLFDDVCDIFSEQNWRKFCEDRFDYSDYR